MSPTFLTLPEELTTHIISFLHCHRPTLHALCLTSRDCNRITTPHLYTRILLSPTSFAYFRPLAYLLFTSPSHAALVRSIRVKRAYGGNLVPWPVPESVVEEALKRVVTPLFNDRMDFRGGEKEEDMAKEWVKSVKEGGAMEVAGLLVRMLPGCSVMGFDGFDVINPRDKSSR